LISSFLTKKKLFLFADESYLTNGYLDTVIDWIPGMRDIRLRDLPSTFLITDPNDPYFKLTVEAVETAPKASGIVVHTFDAFWMLSPPCFLVYMPLALSNYYSITHPMTL